MGKTNIVNISPSVIIGLCSDDTLSDKQKLCEINRVAMLLHTVLEENVNETEVNFLVRLIISSQARHDNKYLRLLLESIA